MTVSAVVSLPAKGGPVMIPLAACSVLSLAVILERAWFWWQSRPSSTSIPQTETRCHERAQPGPIGMFLACRPGASSAC